jgi:hypothetical protein
MRIEPQDYGMPIMIADISATLAVWMTYTMLIYTFVKK